MTSYASSGVDIEAGDRAVELMAAAVAATHGPEVVGGLGGFAGVFDASALIGMERPCLVTSTDGVGTKVAIAQALERHDTIGFDLVGMVVDDLVVCGARPLFMTDYIATGSVVPERIAAIVGGIAAACRTAGVALIGGETAEHPGLMGPNDYDVAGAATGVVEASRLLGPHRVVEGDVLLAMASSGLHSNGYSLVRRVIADQGWAYDERFTELGGAMLGDVVLEPTRVYARACGALADEGLVHAYAHVTGGGLASNLARVMPTGLCALVQRSWRLPSIMTLLASAGGVAQADVEATFNLGVGMVAVVPADRLDAAVTVLRDAGETVFPIGTVAQLAQCHGEGIVAGTKGVVGGAAQLLGSWPDA